MGRPAQPYLRVMQHEPVSIAWLRAKLLDCWQVHVEVPVRCLPVLEACWTMIEEKAAGYARFCDKRTHGESSMAAISDQPCFVG